MESFPIPESVLPPLEAYRFWPSGEAISYGERKKTVRFIFYRVRFSQYEEEQLELLERHIQDRYRDFKFPEWMGKEERIRVLLGCKFEVKKAAEAIFASIAWRNSAAPRSFYSLFEGCEDVLQTGAIYIHGRDHHYRPLLILNVERLDRVHHSIQEYRTLICFLLEFMSKKMMIPGQVENWVVITDLARTSLFDLPISELKSLIKLLQDNFRCRMTVNYIVNAPSSITFAWRLIKVAIEEHTLRKIRILKTGLVEEMRTHFAPHQYEEKYGGTAPNAVVFWPPTMPPAPYHAVGGSPDAHLSDHSTYYEYFPRKSATVPNEESSPPPPTEIVQTPPITEESPSNSTMLRLNFVPIPMLKQDSEEVPDPEIESMRDVRITPRRAKEMPKNEEDREHRGCCVPCGKGKCEVM